jgi:hypothetical protein
MRAEVGGSTILVTRSDDEWKLSVTHACASLERRDSER